MNTKRTVHALVLCAVGAANMLAVAASAVDDPYAAQPQGAEWRKWLQSLNASANARKEKRLNDAIAASTESLRLARELKDKSCIYSALEEMAYNYKEARKFAAAEHVIQELLSINSDSESWDMDMIRLGDLYMRWARYDKAEEAYIKALESAERHSRLQYYDTFTAEWTRLSLVNCYLKRGKTIQATAEMETLRSGKLAAMSFAPSVQSWLYATDAKVHAANNQLEDAERLYLLALDKLARCSKCNSAPLKAEQAKFLKRYPQVRTRP